MITTPERIKVLYVDDEEGNLMAFRSNFRREFDIRVATNAADGIAQLEQEPAHIVISDQRMPVMSGSQFLALVRERWPRSMRIMLTGFSDIEAVIDAVNNGGIHAYITKPWDPLDLKLRIEQAYEVHSLRTERERLFQRYRQVFDSSGDPIVIVDEHGTFHEANPAAEKFIGVPRNELLGSSIRSFVLNADEFVASMRGLRQTKAFNNVDIALRTANGNTLDCLMTATFQGRTEAGAALFQAVIKDITDRKQEELRLKKLNADLDKRVAVRTQQLRDALDDLGAFSYSVAHDLRSPLKSMRALADHLSEMAALKADSDMVEVSGRIHQSASRLVALIDDLLRFARTDTQEVQRASIDIRDIALECLAGMDTADRRMEIQLPALGEAVVPADAAMMRVVLTNLLTNAFKFTRGKDVGRITIACQVDGPERVISVADNGVGFEPDRAGQLFGVFKRLHAADQFEGTGIGLAIVQRIVQKHGGTCWAEGRPGEGATFFLRMPAPAIDGAMRMAS